MDRSIDPLLRKLVEAFRVQLGPSGAKAAVLLVLATGDNLTVATVPAAIAAEPPSPGVVDLRYLAEAGPRTDSWPAPSPQPNA